MEACTTYYDQINVNKIFNDLLLEVGVWLDGKIYWLQNKQKNLNAQNKIHLSIEQDIQEDAFITYLQLQNLTSNPHELKIICQYKDIPSTQHASFVIPNKNIIVKNINENLYLINGKFKSTSPFCTVLSDQSSICEETGHVSYCPTSLSESKGIVVFSMFLEPNEKTLGKTWVVSGQNDKNLLYLNQSLSKTD